MSVSMSVSINFYKSKFLMRQLHKASFIYYFYFCFIRQNLNIYSTYKWEESKI